MADITRSVVIREEDEAFIQGVMRRNGWSRSQVVRAALEKLRADPVLFLADETSNTCESHDHQALSVAH